MDIDLKKLRDIMRAMKQLDVSELELETETERIYLRRGSSQGETTLVTPTMVHAPGYAPGCRSCPDGVGYARNHGLSRLNRPRAATKSQYFRDPGR